MSNYGKLQDAADAEMENEAHLSMTPGHDEAAAQIFARDSAWPANEGGIVSELFNTGSVTVLVAGKTWTVWLEAQEEKPELPADPPDETDTYRETEPPLLGGGP